MDDVARRIEELRREIRRHDQLYYVDAAPEISDRDYDLLLSELKDLEARCPLLVTPDSPTQRVAGEPIEGFQTVEHAAPMLSIDNTYSRDDLAEFDARVRKALGERPFHYLAEPKIDGVAASLRYEGGRLVLAATRGDGRRGDDVTANVRTVRSVPLRLEGPDVPDVVEVRGEIYWPRAAFDACNARRVAEGQAALANPRNGAAGTLKQLDPKAVAERGLAFIAHGFGQLSRAIAPSADEAFKALGRWGVPVSPHAILCAALDEAWEAICHWLEVRHEVDYETDGMVVKVNELALRDELGTTNRYPRWCIAYKYEAERASTVLESVDCQVGRLGTITPVAHFAPVQLAGTTVSSASLHNFDQVERLDLRAGDTVLVEKAGEIIPQVVGVVHEARDDDAPPVASPTTCPTCHNELAWEVPPPGYAAFQCRTPSCGEYMARRREKAEKVRGRDPAECSKCGQMRQEVSHLSALRCVNPECPAQFRERLKFFAARGQMDIDSLGPAVINQLVDSGMVTHFADLYALDAERVAGLERMGAKSAENLLAAVERSKGRGLARVLAAMGIRHVGGRAAEVLAEHFGKIDAIVEASADALAEINEIGPVIAASLREFLDTPGGRHMVQLLRQAGVDMTEERSTAGADAAELPLAGKAVVVTGSLVNFSRSTAKQAVKDAGGRASSHVSKNTDFVVAGESPGSKQGRAEELGVEIIDEEEFLRRLGR